MSSELVTVSDEERPKSRWAFGLDWPTTIGLALIHVGMLAAPFFFTWKAVVLAVVLIWATGGVGICLGYHRLLTHRSFETYRPIRWVIACIGTLAGQGPPITWISTHRKHHRFSDEDDDPHSPRHGPWWSHVLWLTPKHSQWYHARRDRRYAPDVLRERFMRFLSRSYLWWHIGAGMVTFAVGWLGWDLYTGVSFLVYGMFVRLVYVFHVTWFVNSATHIWGYRTYETSDNSRNLWWVGLLAFGEGWHNNHHAFQRVARHGQRWWEFDVTYIMIWLMERVGLAWDVVRDLPRSATRLSEPAQSEAA